MDSYKEDGYIEAIEPTMNKFGFFKSSYHPHHWNWISSSHARRYGFIDSAPAYIKSVSMSEYENTLIRLVPSMGNERSLYALVIEGKRHLINMKSRKALEGLFRAYMDGMRSEHVDQKTWDSIPEGEPWDKYCK